jgi:hypothetical protein
VHEVADCCSASEGEYVQQLCPFWLILPNPSGGMVRLHAMRSVLSLLLSDDEINSLDSFHMCITRTCYVCPFYDFPT